MLLREEPTHPSPAHPTLKPAVGRAERGFQRFRMAKVCAVGRKRYGAFQHQQHHRPAVVSEKIKSIFERRRVPKQSCYQSLT